MKKIILMAILSVSVAFSDVVIGIGGGYKKAMDSIVESYNKTNPKHKVIRRYGNMKFLTTQIQGKEIDALFGLEQMIKRVGMESNEKVTIGYNKIVLVGARGVELDSFEDLKKAKSIVILSPQKGMFGKGSEAFLKNLEFYEEIKPKIIVSEDMHLILEDLIGKKAQVAILNTKYYYDNQSKLGNMLEIPSAFYQPPKVQMAILRESEGLREFIEYLKSEEVRKVLRIYGISAE